jgi:hypothetical protein
MAYFYQNWRTIKSITSSEEAMPTINYLDGSGRRLLYLNKVIELDSIIVMIGSMLKQYDARLAEKIFYHSTSETLSIPSDKLWIDNCRKRDPGYSMFDEPMNKLNQDSLLQFYMDSLEMAGRFTIEAEDGSITWIRSHMDFCMMKTNSLLF